MKLYSKNELKDSRLFFDKKPPIFLTIFIIFTLLLLISTIFVSAILPKSYVVEAQGTITTTDNTYVGSLSDGVLVEMKCPEGTLVNEGDILFTVSNGTEGVQYQSLSNQLSISKQKIEIIDKYIKSLEDNKNYLNKERLQQEYYAKVEYYLSVVNDENKSAELSKTELNKKLEKKKTKETEINSLKDQLSKLTNSEEDKIKKEELESKLEGKESELESLQADIDQVQQVSSSQANQTKLQLISEAGTARTNVETSMVEVQGQIDAYQNQDSLYEVKANHSGYVHYLTPLKEGVAVQKTQTIAEISKNEDSMIMVEAYIEAKDITKVSLNDEVKVAINGVNTQKFGTIKGTLESIDIGTVTQETNNGNLILYKCIISISSKELKASSGETIKATKSMPVTARIIYEEETYLDWLLELLSFTN